MSAKKFDLSFIKQADTDQTFQAHVLGDTDALVVVDVFSKCWGPCRMLEIYFYAGRLDMEDLGRRVSIVHAEVDKISALYEYKNDAKPHFLFYVRGELIASVKGPQLPQIQSLIREHAQPPATPAAC